MIMPRKPRIEFPGAIYHLLNRGNYRGPGINKREAKGEAKGVKLLFV